VTLRDIITVGLNRDVREREERSGERRGGTRSSAHPATNSLRANCFSPSPFRELFHAAKRASMGDESAMSLSLSLSLSLPLSSRSRSVSGNKSGA